MRPRDISGLMPDDDGPTHVGPRRERSELTDLRSAVDGAEESSDDIDDPTVEMAMPEFSAPAHRGREVSDEQAAPSFERKPTEAHNIRGSALVGGLDDPTLPVLVESDEQP